MLTFLGKTQIVHHPISRPQFYNDHGEPTAKETDGPETLEKPPHAGRGHTDAQGVLHRSPL